MRSVWRAFLLQPFPPYRKPPHCQSHPPSWAEFFICDMTSCNVLELLASDIFLRYFRGSSRFSSTIDLHGGQPQAHTNASWKKWKTHIHPGWNFISHGPDLTNFNKYCIYIHRFFIISGCSSCHVLTEIRIVFSPVHALHPQLAALLDLAIHWPTIGSRPSWPPQPNIKHIERNCIPMA